ncbi:MAG: hypothetical protein U1F57_03875 [bacterium]
MKHEKQKFFMEAIGVFSLIFLTAFFPLKGMAQVPSSSPATSKPAPWAVEESSCRQDADCEVTNFPGCCACPQCWKGPPRAVNRDWLKLQQNICAVASCDGSHCNIAGMCPPGEDASHFTARCKAAECALERKESKR